MPALLSRKETSKHKGSHVKESFQGAGPTPAGLGPGALVPTSCPACPVPGVFARVMSVCLGEAPDGRSRGGERDC